MYDNECFQHHASFIAVAIKIYWLTDWLIQNIERKMAHRKRENAMTAPLCLCFSRIVWFSGWHGVRCESNYRKCHLQWRFLGLCSQSHRLSLRSRCCHHHRHFRSSQTAHVVAKRSICCSRGDYSATVLHCYTGRDIIQRVVKWPGFYTAVIHCLGLT